MTRICRGRPTAILTVAFFLLRSSSALIADPASARTGLDRPAARPVDIMGTADIHDFTDKWTGSRIYPSQYGPDGWPGLDSEGEGLRALPPEKRDEIARKWGFPERIPYPGSVEHVRVETQRYIPVVPRYNARTLVKNFRATELSGVAADRIVDYAEPVYFVPKYGIDATLGIDAIRTGLLRRPVKVVQWTQDHPAFKLDLGTLGPGTYTVRVIAATPTANLRRATERLVINFSVNDGVNGAVNTYRKRCAALDEFYSIVEFFFHAPAARAYTSRLRVDDSSRLPLLVYNLDLHDRFALLARAAGKRSAALYDEAERRKAWAAGGKAKADPRPIDKKLAVARKIWADGLPLNAQPMGCGYNESWEGYTRFPLPGGAVDDGMGYDWYGDDRPAVKNLDKLQSFVKIMVTRYDLHRETAYPKAYEYQQRLGKTFKEPQKLTDKYDATGDESAAFDAAVGLAALGQTLLTSGSRQSIQTIDVIPGVGRGAGHGDIAFRRRYKEMWYPQRGSLPKMAEAYDKLFPFIHGNTDLAKVLGEFIPWIKTPADVQRYYDTYILQFAADQIMAYHQYLDSPTPSWMSKVIAVQQDPAVTKPWIEWLFRYVWTYPHIPLGVDELAVNSIGRDGGNRKGSISYSLEGSFLSSLMTDFQAYVRDGGTMPLDMTDPVKFPKAEAGRSFQHQVCVAGGYTFLIGDVGGPNRTRLSYAPQQYKDQPLTAPKTQSRVLANWFGVLETGLEHDDFRFRRAVGVRVGFGTGHHHDDPLDLQIWAHGVPMCGDGGGRTGYAVPANRAVQSHNTVESPLAMATCHRWISSFAPLPGAQYVPLMRMR